MQQYSISQLPVVRESPPADLTDVVGSLQERGLLERVFKDPDALSEDVINAMQPPFAAVDAGETVDRVFENLSGAKEAVLVAAERNPRRDPDALRPPRVPRAPPVAGRGRRRGVTSARWDCSTVFAPGSGGPRRSLQQARVRGARPAPPAPRTPWTRQRRGGSTTPSRRSTRRRTSSASSVHLDEPPIGGDGRRRAARRRVGSDARVVGDPTNDAACPRAFASRNSSSSSAPIRGQQLELVAQVGAHHLRAVGRDREGDAVLDEACGTSRVPRPRRGAPSSTGSTSGRSRARFRFLGSPPSDSGSPAARMPCPIRSGRSSLHDVTDLLRPVSPSSPTWIVTPRPASRASLDVGGDLRVVVARCRRGVGRQCRHRPRRAPPSGSPSRRSPRSDASSNVRSIIRISPREPAGTPGSRDRGHGSRRG